MKPNVGTIDRLFRATLGIALLALAFFSGLPLFATTWVQIAVAAVGVVMLVVSVTRVCPIYAIFGIKTCRS
jgi:hypothetical protein